MQLEQHHGQEIRFGESANQEMCFFWVYYYPRKPGRALLLTTAPAATSRNSSHPDSKTAATFSAACFHRKLSRRRSFL